LQGGEVNARSTEEPKWIDLALGDHPTQGIYALQGDELKICNNEVGTERPSKFASEANSPNDVLMILKREPSTEARVDGTNAEPRLAATKTAATAGPPRLSVHGLAGNQVRIEVLGMGQNREIVLEPLADGTLRIRGEQGVLETKGLVLMLLDDEKGTKPPTGR
jgi:hypothetical protein